MTPCPAIDAAAGGAQTLVGAIDCFVKSSVQESYATLLGPGSIFSQALTIALTLYVAIIGYRLMFGRSTLSLGEFAPKVILIGAVLALSSNWAAYQVLVFDVLTDGPEEIASQIGSQGGNAQGLTARVDAVSGRIADIADGWSKDTTTEADTSPTAVPSPTATTAVSLVPRAAAGTSPGPNLMLLTALLLVLASAGVLAVAKVLLGLMLALGPIFVALSLFTTTRALTIGWARVSVFLALVPLLSLMTTAGALALVEPMVIDMAIEAQAGIFELRSAIALFVGVLVMAAVSFQLFKIAMTITTSGTTSFARSKSVQAAASPDISFNAAALQPSETMNPRIDVLVNAMERSAITSTPTTTMLRSDSMAQSPLWIRNDSDAPQTLPVSRRINHARSASNRAPLRPVRSAA
ncbi:MAG: type IV secretion system protein [Chakrabartia sp.]